MKLLLSMPKNGMLIEDAETHEISFQCLCGQGFIMYVRRIVLTDEEVAEWREGSLDLDRLYTDVNRDDPRVAHRIVPSFDVTDIVGLGKKH